MIVASTINEGGDFDPKEYKRLVRNAIERTVYHARQDFENTVRTWEHKPVWERITSYASDYPYVYFGTSDDIYRWVSEGTKKHTIPNAMGPGTMLKWRKGWTPKTTENWLISSSGSDGRGDWVSKKSVEHPGIKARNFDKIIQSANQPYFEQAVIEALDQASRNNNVIL